MLHELSGEHKDIIHRRFNRVKTLYKQLSAYISKSLSSGYTNKDVRDDILYRLDKPDNSELSTILSNLLACKLSKSLISSHVLDLMLNYDKKSLLRKVNHSAYNSIRYHVITKE
jgi:hypothetical protein